MLQSLPFNGINPGKDISLHPAKAADALEVVPEFWPPTSFSMIGPDR